MKKAITGLAIGAAILSLSACTVEVKESPRETRETSAPVQTVPPRPSSGADNQYIQAIQSNYPAVLSLFNRSVLVELGYVVCQAINEGMTMESMVNVFLSEGFTDMEFMGTVVGSAIFFFCPENGWWVDSAV